MLRALDAESSISGERIGQRGAPATCASGRVCAEHGCATRLSIYNHDTYCSVHGGFPHATRRRRRGGDPAAVREAKRSAA